MVPLESDSPVFHYSETAIAGNQEIQKGSQIESNEADPEAFSQPRVESLANNT